MLSRVALGGAQQAKAEHYRLVFLIFGQVIGKQIFKYWVTSALLFGFFELSAALSALGR